MAFASNIAHQNSGAYLTLITMTRKFAAKLAERRVYLATRRELNNLSDRTLKDLGLHRSQIDRTALDATIGTSRH